MRLPRDLTGQELARALAKLGYVTDRQMGSHLRLTTQENGEHHITVPNHSPIKLGTLNAILREIAEHFDIDRDELLRRLFSKCNLSLHVLVLLGLKVGRSLAKNSWQRGAIAPRANPTDAIHYQRHYVNASIHPNHRVL
jgi:predicted RNA binding protein YcfA (HicA-like mRNA interferase family)